MSVVGLLIPELQYPPSFQPRAYPTTTGLWFYSHNQRLYKKCKTEISLGCPWLFWNHPLSCPLWRLQCSGTILDQAPCTHKLGNHQGKDNEKGWTHQNTSFHWWANRNSEKLEELPGHKGQALFCYRPINIAIYIWRAQLRYTAWNVPAEGLWKI